MKKQITKLAGLSIAMIMLMAPATACKKEKATEASSETTTAATTTTEATTEATTTTETSEEVIVEVADPLYDPNNPMAIDPLTGIQDMDPANVGKRSIGIVVNNCLEANPSRGTSEAAVICEYETEGGQTRMLALFADISAVPEIGSIRSARQVACDLCGGTNSVFTSWGMDKTRFPGYDTGTGINWINLNNYIAGSYYSSKEGPVNLTGNVFCWRDNDWKSKRATEHTGVTNGEQLLRAMEYLQYDVNGDTPRMFNFVPNGTAPMDGATPCSQINVFFSDCNDDALFVYNPEEGVYYKSQYNGRPQMDETTNVQIHFTNVFVLYGNVCPRPNDGEGHLDIHFEEGGTGYYVSYGKIIPITWSKPTPNDLIHIFDMNGVEIDVNAGKSYICVVDVDEIDKTTITP